MATKLKQPTVFTNSNFKSKRCVEQKGSLHGKEQQLEYLQSCHVQMNGNTKKLIAKILETPKPFESIVETNRLYHDVIQSLIDFLSNENLLQPDGAPKHTRQLINQIYAKVITSKLLTSTLNLTKFISDLFEYVTAFSSDLIRSIQRISDLLEYLLVTFPSEYLSLSSCVNTLHSYAELDHNIPALPVHIYKKISCLYDQYKYIKHKHVKTQPTKTMLDQFESNRGYGTLYKDMSIIPSHEEVIRPGQPKLRYILKEGPYPNAEVYMDVLFKLLREDMLSPLRTGIQHLLARSDSARKELYMYDKVMNLGIQCSTRHGILYILTLEAYGVKNPHNIQWDRCQRLKFGTLVCITPKMNNLPTFETTLWGVVADREVDNGTNSLQVSIKFSGDEMNLSEDIEYFMIESRSVYFEAYSHTLSVIQQTIPEDIPMKEIILGHTTRCFPPRYLTRNTQFDFSELFPTHTQGILSVLGDWPCDTSVLDPSQRNALRIALTRQVALIQGPPGTGKTFIGAHTIKILLKARRKFMDSYSWKNSRNSIPSLTNYPILIVTYTNHALDQFLVYLLNYEESIVRIGSRIEQEELKDKTLYEVRKRATDKKRLPPAITKIRMKCGEIRGQLKQIEDLIKTVSIELVNINRKTLTENDIARYATILQYESLIKAEMEFKLVLRKDKNKCDYWLYGNSTKVVQEPRKIDIKRNHVYKNKYFQDENQFRLLADADDDSDEEGEFIDKQSFMDLRIQYSGLSISLDKVIDSNVISLAELIDQKNHSSSSQVIDSLQTEPVLEFEETRRFKRILNNSENEDNVDEDCLEDDYFDLDDEEAQKRVTLDEAISFIDENNLQCDALVPHELLSCTDLCQLKSEDRFRLYNYWVAKKKALLSEVIELYSNDYSELTRKLQGYNLEIDSYVLKKAAIIGMTTTGAARNSELLRKIEPRIIFVEEAAEVLEAHIISSLSKNLEHLILIGDHQQLRPSNAVYELAVNYNLDLSLFERLINNKVEHVTLQCQHRMRPEISKLILPIYPSLQDHPVVLSRDFINGVTSNIFFIDHSIPEDRLSGDTTTRSNKHEAQFVAKLAIYLSKQGYSDQEITILTFYQGQKSKIQYYLNRYKTDNQIKVSTVDKFQGEENTIIIFSVVRSNPNHNIGYCKVENRVCVALSRARNGFYMIGNAKCLLEASKTMKSNLWSLVLRNFHEKIGESLQLCCQNHPNTKTIVRVAEDFRYVRNGGCNVPCDLRMNCGHKCELLCHPYNHDSVKCMKSCERKYDCGHKCIGENGQPKLCYEECGLCTVSVTKQLEGCGHFQENLPCCVEPYQSLCRKPCSKKLACSHMCSGYCGNQCNLIKCQVQIDKQLVCGHQQLIPCYLIDILRYSCKEICGALLECGHSCVGTCGSCYDLIHKPCSHVCNKLLVCGHSCQESCHKPYACAPCKKHCRIRCVHGDCTRVCGDACIPCYKSCEWVCPNFRCKQACSEPCKRDRCFKRCRFKLECGHKCIGICGEPCPLVCSICSPQDKTFDIFFGCERNKNSLFVVLEDCHHTFESSGLDRWIDGNWGERDSGHKHELLKCPRCKAPIIKNLRYGAIVKSIQFEIEQIKEQTKIKMQNYLLEHCQQLITKVKGLEYLSTMFKSLQQISELIPYCDNSKLSIIRDVLQLFSDTNEHPDRFWLHEDCQKIFLNRKVTRYDPHLATILKSAEYLPDIDDKAISNLKRLADKCHVKFLFEKALALQDVKSSDRDTLINLNVKFESSLERDVYEITPDLSTCKLYLHNFLRMSQNKQIKHPVTNLLRLNRPLSDET